MLEVSLSWNLLDHSWNYYKKNLFEFHLFFACAQAFSFFFFFFFFQWTVSCVFLCGQPLKMSSEVNLETSWSSFSTAERPMEIMEHRNRWTKSVETPSQQSVFSSWFILIIDLVYRASFLSACNTAKKLPYNEWCLFWLYIRVILLWLPPGSVVEINIDRQVPRIKQCFNIYITYA